jgi:dephospho-CoA kinase
VSKWGGKYVIGLTGNVATGKSIVRKMLEHLGAYGIDADLLAHRAIKKGAPGYQPVVTAFGTWILKPDQEIDRGKLGRLVFANPDALTILENIVHPLVLQAIDLIIRNTQKQVVVIEAIKLLETNLNQVCDIIWVTYSQADQQRARMIENRRMIEAEAQTRIDAQPAQERKIAEAHVVIRNTGTIEETWRQVLAAWKRNVSSPSVQPAAAVDNSIQPAAVVDNSVQPVTVVDNSVGASEEKTVRIIRKQPEPELPSSPIVLTVVRGRPFHSGEIADFFNRLRSDGTKYTQKDILRAFSEKAFLLLTSGQKMVGVIGWQVENLVARTTDILLDPSVSPKQALPPLITEMEHASKELQCEASLIFVQPELSGLESLWEELGYEQRNSKNLKVLAWQDAAKESMPAGTVMMFRQLRQDRVLRPI